jgi:hypothetical protein
MEGNALRKPAPLSFCPSQIPEVLTSNWALGRLHLLTEYSHGRHFAVAKIGNLWSSWSPLPKISWFCYLGDENWWPVWEVVVILRALWTCRRNIKSCGTICKYNDVSWIRINAGILKFGRGILGYYTRHVCMCMYEIWSVWLMLIKLVEMFGCCWMHILLTPCSLATDSVIMHTTVHDDLCPALPPVRWVDLPSFVIEEIILSGNGPDLYSGCAQFDSRQGHQLCRLMFSLYSSVSPG